MIEVSATEEPSGDSTDPGLLRIWWYDINFA